LVTLCSDYALADDRDRAREVAGQIIERDPEFRVSSFAGSQPYRDTAKLDEVVSALRAAGLPA
ncbi:MAG: hypothetical protein ACOC9Q_02400, partial [bacterium]